MSIEKLKRVMWRLQEKGLFFSKSITRTELRRAICYECGTDLQTFYNNVEALVALGWVRRHKTRFKITDEAKAAV